MIDLVISGGQTGADQAGWRAAKAAGIPAGGWMPRGFKTEDGPRPEFAELYGAKEHESPDYPPRTRVNVNTCDVLIWFVDPKSHGGRLTLGVARQLAVSTPTLVVPSYPSPFKMPGDCADWLGRQAVSFGQTTLAVMVAGNRESFTPGIGAWVEAYMAEVFRLVNGS